MTPSLLSRTFSPYILTIGLLLSLFSLQGVAMAFFSKKEVVLSSPMEGVLTYEGEPVEGAELMREIRWQSETGQTDSTTTDQNGYFHFDMILDSWRQLLPAEFVVYQDVYVHYNDETFHIWTTSKRVEEKWGELGGKPINFRCELTDELKRVETPRGLLGTSCKWDFIESKEPKNGAGTADRRTAG